MVSESINSNWRTQGMKGPYDDIINLPHHKSDAHPQMSIYNRAIEGDLT